MWWIWACTDPLDTSPEKDSAADSVSTDTGESGDTSTDTVDSESDSPTDTVESGETGPPLPVDEDGDGYPVEEDCDDTDATIHPGAQETCDEVDRDCDGEPLADGVCGEEQDVNVIAGMFPDDYYVFRIVPDVDGDGKDDLMYPIDAGVVPGGWPLDAYTTTEADRLFYFEVAAGCGWSLTDRLGDVDGDGISDFVIVNRGPCNQIYVVGGPYPTDGSGVAEDHILFKYDASTYIYEDSVFTWLDTAQTADLDADGRLDTFANEPSEEDVQWPLSFWFGGDEGQPSVRLTVGTGCTDCGDATGEGALGDIDGDGADDLYVWPDYGDGWRQGVVLSGADMRGADGAPTEDLMLLEVPYNVEGGLGAIDHDFVDVGDVTDDGLDDFFINAFHSERLGFEHGEALLVEGGTTGEIDPDALAQSYVPPADCWGIDSGGGAGLPSNFDGEGAAEVFLTFCDINFLATIDLDGLLTEPRGIPLRLTGGISVGDPTGDGRDDLYWYGDDSPNGHLLTGWDVPWGEDRYW